MTILKLIIVYRLLQVMGQTQVMGLILTSSNRMSGMRIRRLARRKPTPPLSIYSNPSSSVQHPQTANCTCPAPVLHLRSLLAPSPAVPHQDTARCTGVRCHISPAASSSGVRMGSIRAAKRTSEVRAGRRWGHGRDRSIDPGAMVFSWRSVVWWSFSQK